MRVFLLHGMGRTPASMLLLAWRLRAAGHQPKLFGYTVTLDSLEKIRDRFVATVEQVRRLDRDNGDEGPYAAVGHSLGNLIVRYASPNLVPGLGRVVQMAPPNQSPAIARLLQNNLIFQAITQDAGRRLVDPDFFATLPISEAPTLVVAGNAGPRFERAPFEEPNDGILKVSETVLEGSAQLLLPCMHTFIMNRQDLTRALLAYLADPDPEKARAAAMPSAPS